MRTHSPLLTCLALAVLMGSAAAPPVARSQDEPVPVPTVAECKADASAMEGWDTPAPPRRIFGNTWYVGTCGITVLLVTSPQGHVLIDGGTAAAPPIVEASIRALGFDPRDVKFIVASHTHFDHVAGVAGLQRATGARVLMRAPALATMQRGKSDRDDPQFLELPAFTAVPTAEVLPDDGKVRVGALELTAHATPGHTRGGTSWTWRSCEGGRCVDLAYADSLSAISDDEYRYSDHPEDLAAFRAGLDTVSKLPCDVLVTPHPVASNLFARLHGSDGAAVVESGACARYAAEARRRLEERLLEERGR